MQSSMAYRCPRAVEQLPFRSGENLIIKFFRYQQNPLMLIERRNVHIKELLDLLLCLAFRTMFERCKLRDDLVFIPFRNHFSV
jgi:hypothetical protein